MTRSPQQLYDIYSRLGPRGLNPTQDEAKVLAQVLMKTHAADYFDKRSPLHDVVVTDLRALYEVSHPEQPE